MLSSVVTRAPHLRVLCHLCVAANTIPCRRVSVHPRFSSKPFPSLQLRPPYGSLPCSTQSTLTPFLSCICRLFSLQRRGIPPLATRHSSPAANFLRMNTSAKCAHNSFS